MNDDVAGVDQDPVARFLTLDLRDKPEALLDPVDEFLGNRGDLTTGAAEQMIM